MQTLNSKLQTLNLKLLVGVVLAFLLTSNLTFHVSRFTPLPSNLQPPISNLQCPISNAQYPIQVRWALLDARHGRCGIVGENGSGRLHRDVYRIFASVVQIP